MEISQNLNLADLISLFEGKMDEQPVLPPKEIIEIADRAALEQNLCTGARDIWDAFNTTNYATGHQADRDDMTRRYQFLLKRKVDEATPITLFSMKARIKEQRAPEEERLFLTLLKGELPDGDTETLYKANQLVWKQGRGIGSLTIRVKENDFEIIDRLVAPQFREQGIGSLMLGAVEAMAEKKATDTDTKIPQRIHAETAQLDVICWLWNRGYRPSSPEDQSKLDAILGAAPDLLIGENLYIFDKAVSSSERTWRNRKNAFRLRLEKTIYPEMPAGIERQRTATHAKHSAKPWT